MSTTSTDLAEETITHSQRRRLFEDLVGARAEANHGLWSALDQVINSARDERDNENDLEVATLCQHFPALESVMLLVWEHHVRAGGNGDASCRICEPASAEGIEA